jgi:hypothetical protein
MFAQKRGWVNFKNKERPSMGNILGTFDELFSPSKHQAQILLEEKKEQRVEVSSSDDNHIHIDLRNR